MGALLLSLQKLFGHPLGDQGRIAPSPVIDKDARLNVLLDRLPHQIGRVHHHIFLEHTLHELVKGVSL
jgi:hypothetical protein